MITSDFFMIFLKKNELGLKYPIYSIKYKSSMEKNSINCKFCQHSFSNKQNLKSHQKKAKYCLKLRNIEPLFQCNGCKKNFSSKYNLKVHKTSCHDLEIATYKTIIKKLEKENEDLKDKLQEALLKAIERPTTKIDQRIMNLQPISAEYFRECAKGYTIEHVKDPDGMYKYLHGTYDGRCATTDFSRRIVKYSGEDGEIVTDPNMMKLLKAALEAIEGTNKELTTKCLNDIRDYCDQNPMNFPPSDLSQFQEDRVKDVLINKWIIKNVCEGNPQSDETKAIVKELCAGFA